MQLLKKIFDAIFNGVTNLILFIIAELGKISFLGEGGAIILVYIVYLLALILFVVFGITSFVKNKYRTSIYFFVAALLMIGYFLILAYNIGHKAD